MRKKRPKPCCEQADVTWYNCLDHLISASERLLNFSWRTSNLLVPPSISSDRNVGTQADSGTLRRAAFSCLDTTRKDDGSAEAFRKVDLEYVAKFAEVPKAQASRIWVV
ncbi:hypothetical protein PI124_g11614 [Phytophthora idaei]|nr:hypothetical protein PI124_g11614 [Phytophthora idaei]